MRDLAELVGVSAPHVLICEDRRGERFPVVGEWRGGRGFYKNGDLIKAPVVGWIDWRTEASGET